MSAGEKEFISDAVVGFLTSPIWNFPVRTFIEQNSLGKRNFGVFFSFVVECIYRYFLRHTASSRMRMEFCGILLISFCFHQYSIQTVKIMKSIRRYTVVTRVWYVLFAISFYLQDSRRYITVPFVQNT